MVLKGGEATLSKLFCLPSENSSTLKRKNVLCSPRELILSFYSGLNSKKGFGVEENIQDVTKYDLHCLKWRLIYQVYQYR